MLVGMVSWAGLGWGSELQGEGGRKVGERRQMGVWRSFVSPTR